VAWRCDECGLDYGELDLDRLVELTRPYPERWAATLTGTDDAHLRRRPDDTTWSALEYGAHVRDVLDILTGSLERMAADDHPDLDFPDPDELAAERRYGDEDPAAVVSAIGEQTDRLLRFLEQEAAPAWARTGTFPWGERDVETMAKNTVHEHVHHLLDAERVLAATR
jgi:hypothetical protein